MIQGQGGRTSSGSLGQQLEGVWRELTGPERGTLGALKGAKGPREAARIFSERFERPGVPMLGNRERYAQEALQSFAGGKTGGSSAGGGSGPQEASVKGSGGQGEALASLVAQLSKSQGSGVEGFTVPKVGLEGEQGPKVPRELPSPEASSPALLQALAGLSEGKGPEAKLNPSQPEYSMSPGKHGPLAGLLPAGANLKLGRIDEGQDGQTNPGGAIVANGNFKVVAVKSDPGRYGPSYPVVVFSSGPLAGKGPIYFGHTLAAVHPGQRGSAGQVISHTGKSPVGNASVPGWFEIGLAETLGQGNRGQGARLAPILARR